MNSLHIEQHRLATGGTISEDHVEAFLTLNSPCYSHFPTEMREAVREYLQRQMDVGDLTREHLEEYQRRAATTILLRD
jgi:hypothetical protein